jgi:hypothetical protein
MKKHLGQIGIDAGLCWIGDPCYVLPDGSDHNPGANWKMFCDELNKNDKLGEPTTRNFDGIGVCVGTGYGDGEYPVTAEIKGGRVMSVTVDFSGGPDKEDL